MTVSKAATDAVKPSRPNAREPVDGAGDNAALQMGELSDLLGYLLKEIANTLGILRPNFVSMLDALESRDLCTRMRSTNDRRSHILMLTDKGRAVLARAKKLVATKHEARLNELLGPDGRIALLDMLSKIAAEF